MPGSDNAVAIDIISTHIRRKLDERATHLRQRLAGTGPRDLVAHGSPHLNSETLNLTLLPEAPQVKVCRLCFLCSVVRLDMCRRVF